MLFHIDRSSQECSDSPLVCFLIGDFFTLPIAVQAQICRI